MDTDIDIGKDVTTNMNMDININTDIETSVICLHGPEQFPKCSFPLRASSKRHAPENSSQARLSLVGLGVYRKVNAKVLSPEVIGGHVLGASAHGTAFCKVLPQHNPGPRL